MSKILNIEKVEFRNFLSFGNKIQTFEPNGLSFITGLNPSTDRRNFCGKTNLLRVFPFGLFGNVEGLIKNRIVNWRNKKNLEVVLNFSKNGNKYILTRGIKPDVLKISENGVDLPTPPNKKDFQQQIEKEILEMDYDTFMRIVYADTNNSASILTLTKPKKREFLEQMFNLEYFTEIKDKANKKINNIGQQVSQLEQQIENDKKTENDLIVQVQNYKNTLNNLQDSTKTLEKKEKLYKETLSTYDDSNEKLEELNVEKEKGKEKKDKSTLILSKINSKITNLTNRYINKKIESVDDTLIKKESETKEKEKEKFKNSLKEVKHFENEIFTIKKYIETNEKKLKNNKLNDISTCPTCMQSIDHDLIKHFYEHDIEENEKILQENEEKIKKWEIKSDEIKENEKNKKINDAIKIKTMQIDTEIGHLNHKLKEIKGVQLLQNKKLKYISVIPKLEKAQIKIKSDIETINELLGIIDAKETYLKEFLNSVDEMKREIETLKDKVIYEEKERKRIQDWIKETENKKVNLIKEIDKNNKDVLKLKTIKDYFIVIKDITADKESKQYAISNKVPLLNQRVNQYLSKSGVNYYVKLDGWLEPEIRGPGIKDCSYENLSGAERVSIDRSLQFAFNDINKFQSPTHLNLMILDELLDSSMDSQGLQYLMQIVKKKQQDDKSNILIVSHRSETLNELEEFFDNKYVILFEKGFSYIKKL